LILSFSLVDFPNPAGFGAHGSLWKPLDGFFIPQPPQLQDAQTMAPKKCFAFTYALMRPFYPETIGFLEVKLSNINGRWAI
jgi:hypothetical protein